MIAAVKNKPDVDDPRVEEIVSHYTWGRVFERILSVYQDAICQKFKQ
jgi:hypothetical protein